MRITTICDVDRNVIGKANKAISSKYGSEPKYVQDLRRVFDDKDIDAVSIATPNHWHALATIWACQAGKDVYVEKPVSHNVQEGRRAVEAARKYGRIVQAGTQCRSHKGIQDAVAFLRSGELGQIYMAKGLCYKPRGSIGFKPDSNPPAGLDYNLWVGPAEMKPFNENRLHYNWHWFWNTGNGDLGNQGIHQMDLARWGLGKNEFPKTVHGLRRAVRLQGPGRDAQHRARRLRVRRLRAPVRGPRPADQRRARGQDRRHLLRHQGRPGDHQLHRLADVHGRQAGEGPRRHRQAATTTPTSSRRVKSRDVKALNGDIEEGHLSSAYCHLGNIAYKLGRKLHINPSSETFVNDAEADAMLTREYRPGFVVPTKV